jgi:hypothetical protein
MVEGLLVHELAGFPKRRVIEMRRSNLGDAGQGPNFLEKLGVGLGALRQGGAREKKLDDKDEGDGPQNPHDAPLGLGTICV